MPLFVRAPLGTDWQSSRAAGERPGISNALTKDKSEDLSMIGTYIANAAVQAFRIMENMKVRTIE